MIAWSQFLPRSSASKCASTFTPSVRRLFSYSAAAADWRGDGHRTHKDGRGFRRQSNDYESNYDRNDRSNDRSDFGVSRSRGGSNFESRDRSWGQSGDVGSRLTAINWDNEAMRPYKKDLYNEDKRVANRTDEENAKIIEELKATVKGRDVPKPILTFDEMELTFGKQLMEEIKGTGFTQPSPVQKVLS